MSGYALTLDNWVKSVVCFAHEIHNAGPAHSLLGQPALDRDEYMFSDEGIPIPRPCTALAWASLCAFGPVNMPGFKITEGAFLLPFLPKIRYGEETNQSLIRTSKAHQKDSFDNIRWGNVFIGDSKNGQIIEQLTHGAYPAKAWMAESDRARFNAHDGQHPIPPLYAYIGEGWQFGVIQNLPSMPVTLRDPFIELARHGIPILGSIPNVYNIRRLLFRFLEIGSARRWATGYSAAMLALNDSHAPLRDAIILAAEIRKANEERFAERIAASSSKTKSKHPRINLGFDQLSTETLALLDLTDKF